MLKVLYQLNPKTQTAGKFSVMLYNVWNRYWVSSSVEISGRVLLTLSDN